MVVTTYALMMLLGVATATLVAVAFARSRSLPRFDVFAAGMIGFGTGLFGAKLLYLLLHGPALVAAQGWSGLLQPPGLVWYGGAAGGALGFVLYSRAYGLNALLALDVTAPGLAFGHALGRVGCFTAGCCYGRLGLDLPFAVWFPKETLAPPGIPLHPVQLYESVGLVSIGIVVSLVLWRGRRLRAGRVFAGYLGAYALLRFATEFFRHDDRGIEVGPLSPSQVIALWVIAGTIFFVLSRRDRDRAQELPSGAD